MKIGGKIFREPLVHFFVLGSLLFIAYGIRHSSWTEGDGTEEIRVGAGEVQWLSEMWERQWNREPSPEELRGLLTDYIHESLLAREAREMGLDEDDTIIRRRLAQKLQFLVQDTALLIEPDESTLQQYYVDHAEEFQTEPKVSFEQVYFNPDQRPDAASDAKFLLTRLSASGGAAPSEAGDRTLLESRFSDAHPAAVAAMFGEEFSREIFAMEEGRWHGPIRSSYGLHLVQVSEISPSVTRPFDEVKAEVLERWQAEQQRTTESKYYEELKKKYRVAVDESVAHLLDPPPIAGKYEPK